MHRKSKAIAIIMALFLGWAGGHKFYLGQTAAGVFYVLFCWTLIPAFIATIEFWVLVFTSEQRFDAKYNLHYDLKNRG
jgi:TM2 domain-containing membrane protein YozV